MTKATAARRAAALTRSRVQRLMVAVAAASRVGSMTSAPPSDKAYITSMHGGHCIAKGVDIEGIDDHPHAAGLPHTKEPRYPEGN